jgi:chromosome partitioning protein
MFMNLVSSKELSQSLAITPQRVANLAKQLNIDSTESTIKGKTRHFMPSAIKKILSHRGLDYSTRETMAFCNNKGGIGKTTIACTTAMRLASLGFKVLLIDADAQSNTSNFFVQNVDYQNILLSFVEGKASFEECIINLNDNLSILPSTLENHKLNLTLSMSRKNPQTLYSNEIDKLDYNFVIWDLCPELSISNQYALLSCSMVNIVTPLREYSVQGLEMTLDIIQEAMNNFNDYRPSVKALINMFDTRLTTSMDMFAPIKETGIDVYSTVIGTDNSFEKAQKSRQALPSNSNAHKHITEFVDEMLNISQISKQLKQ